MRMHGISVLVALLALGGTAALASPPGFDEPLAEFSRTAGGDVHSAASGVGTADGANSFAILTPGTVLEAWVYWSGEVRRDPVTGTVYGPDPGLTLSGGAIVGSLPVVGAEVARRLALPDDGDNGGEVVMKAAVPPSAFLAGGNTFVISAFNEINPVSGMSYYRRQHGVAMLVTYRGDEAGAQRETILLEGGDWFFKDRFNADPNFADEIAGELVCFDFNAALECGQSAFLRFAVGGLVEQPLSVNERTFVLSGSGPKPGSLLGGVGSLLEQNTLNLNLETGGFFRGRKLAVYEGEVPLGAGDTWLCYQIEHDLATGRQFPDPYFNFFASLDLDRSPCDGDGCLTRTPGFWGNHPHVTTQYLSLDSCGLTLDSTLPRSIASATEDMCISGQDAKGAKTSMQQLQLVRQCMAANLNLAASAAGGGSCDSAIGARIAECCASLCNSGAAGNTISRSMCIEDIDEFNNSADSLEPYGPFLSPGPADPSSCKSSRGNGWVNTTDDQGDKRKLGPANGGKGSSSDSPSAPSRRSSPTPPGASAKGKH
ncbi:MAG: hypothetical protein MUF27_09270 [Acidobacteria bacterium]|nr:hypothetical protein [Acidobacteriota bacterium]